MNDLTGLKVLLVEDEAGVALLIEDMLQECGCELVASVAQLNKACDAARMNGFDLAIVDVNLRGQSAIPVAHILQERGIPFVFSTGYGVTAAPPEFKEIPLLSKPFVIEDLRARMAAALAMSSTRI